ncbi:MAG: YibE/F family protein [Patescibacteria group bacterium]
MNKILYALLTLATIALFLIDLNPPTENVSDYEEVIEGTVQEITETSSIETIDGTQHYQKMAIEVTRGSLEGELITVENGATASIYSEEYEPGDRLVIIRSENMQGEDIFSVVDTVRRPLLFWLFILFVAVVALVSQKQGMKALLGMVFSFFVLFRLVLPLILLGYSPVWSAIGGCVLIIPATFYLSHGVKHKTSVAILGTLVTLVLTGVMAYIFAHLGNLTGLADEAASFLKSDTGDRIDFQGLLLAGILISMLGVLDDVSVSQAAIVQELEGAKKNISFVELYRRTMTVGKDHIASMVNTLVLVYAGASIPLLLLFIDHSHTFYEVLNYEFVAEEIIQTLVASIGLILTVPVTTFIACIWHRKSA